MIRVAITTSADRIERVSEAFSCLGLVPVALPCVHIEAAGAEVLADVRQAVVPGVTLLLSAARPLDLLWPAGEPPPVPVVTVGTATANAVRQRGGRVEYVGSVGLEALLDDGILDGKRIVFPHAAGTDPAALERIVARAASLEAPVVYETVPQPPGNAEVDAVAFGSPSAVRGWVSARDLEGLFVGVIGATTAVEVESAGYRPDVVAPRPGFAALAEAMAQQLEVMT
ncbi:MAG: uroporphyrinogen-III synthase [Actinomycetota bacterium]